MENSLGAWNYMEIFPKGLKDPMGIPLRCWRLRLGPIQRFGDLMKISQMSESIGSPFRSLETLWGIPQEFVGHQRSPKGLKDTTLTSRKAWGPDGDPPP